jgi:hypothetical protein
MLSRWAVPVVWAWTLGVLSTPNLARGEPMPGSRVCLPMAEMAGPSEVLQFRGSAGVESDFRSTPSGCGGVLDGIFGSGPWARAAGSAVEASRVMFGLNLDMQKLIEIARNLGLAPRASDRPGLGPLGTENDDELHVSRHPSLLLRVTRKRVLLGVEMKW